MILRPVLEKLFKFREHAASQQRARAGADEGFDPHEKPFLDHLEDLRKTLMKVISALFVTTILGFAFHKQIFHFALQPLSMASFDAEQGGGTLADRIHFLVLSPPEILMLSIKVSFFAGLIGAFPLLVFFIGEFVMPGLKQQEKKLVVPGIGIGFALFITGAAFAFFMATPIALKFFYQFQVDRVGFYRPTIGEKSEYSPVTITNEEGTAVSATDITKKGVDALGGDGTPAEVDPYVSTSDLLPPEQRDAIRDLLLELIVIEQGSDVSVSYRKDLGKIVISTGSREKIQYRIGEYISFVTRLVLVFGISFQLPVVVTILVKLQLLTARVMRATRAFAWVIMLVLAAIFTPPDVFTLGLLAGPLILLYEICIWIAWGIENKREKRREEEELAERERLNALYSKPADTLSEAEKEELHRREIEQYERDHEQLDEDHYHDENGHGHGHDDPDHPGLGTDPHAIGYDPHHDEGWHEGDDPYHNDPHHYDPEHDHDPHEDAEAHQPTKDWPDRDDESKTKSEAEAESDSADTAPADDTDLESDHAEPADDQSQSASDSDGGEDSQKSDPDEPAEESDSDSDSNVDDENGDDDNDDDEHQACEPSGAIVNPNVATMEELMSLPGVDAELADHILLYRPFDNFDELMEVPGMEEDILNEIIDRMELE